MVNEVSHANYGNNVAMNDPTLNTAVMRHGAYCWIRSEDHAALRKLPVDELAERHGFTNEYAVGHPDRAVAYVRRVDAVPAQIHDDDLLSSDALLHVADAKLDVVQKFVDELLRLTSGTEAYVRVTRGVQRTPAHSSAAMQEFAYAHQVQQRRGSEMPHVFVVPMSKTAEWWAKDWMERHTYFLPRYDGNNRQMNEGHMHAAAPGIPYLYRRTYKHATLPAPEGEYDFVNYFECAEEGVAVFREVCTALRDTSRNPEWAYVREGPTFQGLRVATWAELFD